MGLESSSKCTLNCATVLNTLRHSRRRNKHTAGWASSPMTEIRISAGMSNWVRAHKVTSVIVERVDVYKWAPLDAIQPAVTVIIFVLISIAYIYVRMRYWCIGLLTFTHSVGTSFMTKLTYTLARSFTGCNNRQVTTDSFRFTQSFGNLLGLWCIY